MAWHLPSWLRETFRVWSQYLAIAVAAIPAAVLAVVLIGNGFAERAAMIICVPLALLMAFVLWNLCVWLQSERVRTESQFQIEIKYISSPTKTTTVVVTAWSQEEEHIGQQVYPSSVVKLGQPNTPASIRQLELVA